MKSAMSGEPLKMYWFQNGSSPWRSIEPTRPQWVVLLQVVADDQHATADQIREDERAVGMAISTT